MAGSLDGTDLNKCLIVMMVLDTERSYALRSYSIISRSSGWQMLATLSA
jgi:hypothetical protein